MDSQISPDKLKSFVRKNATKFLLQDNINSVGIGYKHVNGKKTDVISIQFTVDQKVGLEVLESIDENVIPKSFVIDGVEVPTDVIERRYEQSAKVIVEKEKSLRKNRLDPIYPGCSIGHPSISAGTLGCVVYDRMNGEEYVLSNWHVLQGNLGRIGDKIVQPGAYDDSRVESNYAGRLINSHLGLAGDCAIAKIEGRRLEKSIIDVGVEVKSIYDPQLGDKVVKSGRTTSVTYGLVSRINVTTKIDYGEVGVVQIGCFEYVPDPENPPADGEVSMGGDSGSAVMLVQKGKASTVLAGLHFAGEVGNEPENALACYATSVFEKLAISATPPSRAQIQESIHKGYNSNFLEKEVGHPLPLNDLVEMQMFEFENKNVFDYTHFSLSISRSRKMAAWVSWNIDGGNIKFVNSASFRKDPKLPGDAQIGNELYKNNDLDRGHIARRAELCWGPIEEAQMANDDSFYFTNIVPQHKRFNQSKMAGIWGELENAVFEQAKIKELKVSVMAGPLFGDDDQLYRGVQIPKEFWKVVFYIDEKKKDLVYHCFILTQKDLINDLESLDFDEFKLYKVTLSAIEEKTGFEIKDLKKFTLETIEAKPVLIESKEDVLVPL